MTTDHVRKTYAGDPPPAADSSLAQNKRLRWGLLGVFALVVLYWTLAQAGGKRDALGTAQPARLAYFESTGWRAYYDRDWPRVLTLMVQLNREQFGMSWPTAILAAVDVVRASVAFAPVDNDIPAATTHLSRFYTKARDAAGISMDAQTLAELEISYWVSHRQLANERKAAPDHTGDLSPMVDALARLHEAVFAVPPDIARLSAERRANAAALVDGITGGYSDDVDEDWQRIEAELARTYQILLSTP